MNEYDEILGFLESDFAVAVSKIKPQNTDKNEKIGDYRKEYAENERDFRDMQLGKIQKDKNIQTENGSKLVRVVKVPIAFAKKIVRTATAFEVGKPPVLIPSEKNNLTKLVELIWKNCRLDHIIFEMIRFKKSETQSAVQFYIQDVEPTSFFAKMLSKFGITNKKTIRTKLLDNNDGQMYPYFDSQNNLILFMWVYDYNSGNKKTTYYEVWTKEIMYRYSLENGSYTLISNKKHGFDRIPIVYVSQEQPEWFEVKELIDRYEVSLSKLGSSNDYFAHPILATYGEVQNLPDKDESGKVINFPRIVDENDPTKYSNGDAKFLTADGDNAAKTLELDTLYKNIHSMSSTPDLSFENVKGLGTVSGVAMKLMFMDAIIKALSNEGENRTAVERMLNIIISGIINTTNVSLKSQSNNLYYDVKFNSIIPSDFKEIVDWVTSLRDKGMLSKETALSLLDIVDVQAELQKIKEEAAQQQPTA